MTMAFIRIYIYNRDRLFGGDSELPEGISGNAYLLCI